MTRWSIFVGHFSLRTRHLLRIPRRLLGHHNRVALWRRGHGAKAREGGAGEKALRGAGAVQTLCPKLIKQERD